MRKELADTLEQGLCEMLEHGMPIDDLASLSDSMEMLENNLSSAIHESARNAIQAEFNDIRYIIEDADSESTLEDRIRALKKLAPRADIATDDLANAVSMIEDRIAELEEETTVANSPSLTGLRPEPDKFDDDDLQNLFEPLLDRG